MTRRTSQSNEPVEGVAPEYGCPEDEEVTFNIVLEKAVLRKQRRQPGSVAQLANNAEEKKKGDGAT
ncbi:hypothetical protein [Bradyrhizobium guangdongense]